MIRSELVTQIARKHPGLSTSLIRQVCDAVIEEMTHALADGNRVEIRGLFSAWTVRRRARSGRNPRTGTKVDVIEKHAIAARCSAALLRRMNPEVIFPKLPKRSRQA